MSVDVVRRAPAGAHLLPAVRLILDEAPGGGILDPLTDGHPVDHLRYKPGRSVVGRVHGPGGPRWIAGFSPRAAAKAGKLRHHAARRGLELPMLEVPGAPGHVLLAGPVGEDKRLHRALKAAGLLEAGGGPRGHVLNYNPWRRLVLELPPGVLAGVEQRAVAKTAAAPHGSHGGAGATLAQLVAGLHREGVPVLVPRESADPRTLVYPHYGWGDWAGEGAGPDEGTCHAAAEALARLHRSAVHPFRHVDPAARAAAAVRAVSTVVPGAGEAAGRIARALLDAAARHDGSAHRSTHGVVHGDFSADQVLLGPDGIRFIDLDRIALGPAGWDLGCFAASELLAGRGTERSEELLAAYGAGAPRLRPAVGAFRAWTGLHVLLRAVEPFRENRADWAEQVVDRVRLAATAGLR
ncbi:phosphotransferase family protein [Zafaria sp. Z1313]|uniref:hypothetical protein n=1 Tax=unclassified Zafaria TaxID=2828765 RepID=UPI002E76C187|nr:hypothetical protein [Zafaria sp. J156]MEE1620621.1 hypothetical protein [Zafaria sp. J156]